MTAALILKPGREASLLRRHPWVFSGAVGQVFGQPAPGETVTVRDAAGGFLAQGAYSPASQIVARAWTFDEDEAVDAAFFRRRLEAAIRCRSGVATLAPTSPVQHSSFSIHRSLRLVHAESDGLPGLIVDKYADTLVLQSLTAGSEVWKPDIAAALMDLLAPTGIFERSDAPARAKEGLPPAVGPLAGTPPERVEIEENGLVIAVDLRGGHKTGGYLDQRENRQRVAEAAAGREVLDAFCYTGGFALAALQGGARSALALDSAGDALAVLRENAARNGFGPERLQTLEADAFRQLRQFRDSRQSFDLIVLDPPKFAQSAAQVDRAARAYKDINLLAFKLLRPGGLLFTFSCSGAVSPDLFQKIVAGAALDAGVDAQILRRLSQPPDHPVALAFPEGEYLKGLVCLRL